MSAAVAIGVCLSAASADEPANRAGDNRNESHRAAKKAIATVEPVRLDGVEYRVVYEHDRQDGRPRGMRAFIEARDANTKESLWRVQVYDIRYREDMEAEAQDVYIKELELHEAMSWLIATDDRGGQFYVYAKVPFLFAPAKSDDQTLTQWFDSVARRAKPYQPTAGENTWLLFRSSGIGSQDRLRIESVHRQGSAFTVTMEYERYVGSEFARGVVHPEFSVDLGKLPAGEYTVKWVIHRFWFGPQVQPTRDETPQLVGFRSFTVTAAPQEGGGDEAVKDSKAEPSN